MKKKWGPFVFRRSLRIINKKSWKIVKDHTQLRMIEIAYEKKVGAFCHPPFFLFHFHIRLNERERKKGGGELIASLHNMIIN